MIVDLDEVVSQGAPFKSQTYEKFSGLIPHIEYTDDQLPERKSDRIALAKSLLKASGYDENNRLSLTLGSLNISSYRPYLRKLNQQLGEVYIDANLVSYHSFKELIDKSLNKEIDMSVFTWSNVVNDTFYFLRAITEKGFVWDETSIPQIESLIEAVGDSPSIEERDAIGAQITKLVFDEAYIIPLFSRLSVSLYNDSRLDISQYNLSFPRLSDIKLN